MQNAPYLGTISHLHIAASNIQVYASPTNQLPPSYQLLLSSMITFMSELSWSETDLVIAGGNKIWLDRVEVNRMKGMAATCKTSNNCCGSVALKQSINLST